MKLDDKQKDHLINFGALRYSASIIASLLDLDESACIEALEDPKSEMHRIYKHGAQMANYRIQQKLLEMAQGGDIQAIRELKKMRLSKRSAK